MRGEPTGQPWTTPAGADLVGAQGPPGLRLCPACRNEKSYFVGKVCGDCYAQGRDLEAGAASREPRAERRNGTERAMSQKTECPWCHGMKANLYEHAKWCKQRPDGAELPRKRKRGKSRGARPRKLRSAAGPEDLVIRKKTDCAECPYRGLETAQAQDLVTEAVRGGMGLVPALGFIRHVLGADRRP